MGAMLRRMAREGLVETKPNKEVVLTTSGREAAESVVRRHRMCGACEENQPCTLASISLATHFLSPLAMFKVPFHDTSDAVFQIDSWLPIQKRMRF